MHAHSMWPHRLTSKGKGSAQFRSKDLSSAKEGRNKYSSGRLRHNVTKIDSLGPAVSNDSTKVLHFHTLQ